MTLSEPVHRAQRTLALLDVGALALRPFHCPLCGRSVLVRFARHAIGVRCLRCAASAISLSLISVLNGIRPDLGSDAVFELSGRGPLVTFLRARAAQLTCSEYFDDVPHGEMRAGVMCQDVQRLTFADATFDLCTSTEVFEHVPDDRLGFREVHRVLRPGGLFVFTVPLADADDTIERARLDNGRIVHLRAPEYHGDRLRGPDRVLAFRNYGRDIVGRLRACGFADATIDWRYRTTFLGYGTGVVIARAVTPSSAE